MTGLPLLAAHAYPCSYPGQNEIVKAIREVSPDRVVLASCSQYRRRGGGGGKRKVTQDACLAICEV